MVLIIGVFNPTLYGIGGGEVVTINMINALKQQGYKVIISANKKINQTKPINALARARYGKNVAIDAQIVFPFHLFPPYNVHNVYTIALQTYILRLKCNILIDTCAVSPFPWADIIYFQGPSFSFERLSIPSMRKIFFLPYITLLKSIKNLNQKIIFANSKFTAEALIKQFSYKDISPYVLYPPVATNFFNPDKLNLNKSRDDVVVAFSRLSKEKRLEVISRIAKLTDKRIFFIIAGNCQSVETLYSIQKSIKKLKVTKRVKVFPNITQDQLRTLLWNSKAYLHTGKYEPFGITIAEAMSSGCIPVVHDSGGPREFVPEYLRYKSIEEAAMKIEKAISEWSPEHAERMLSIANRFNEKEFSKKFLNIVNQLISDKCRR